ncbi:hypothetical protein [Gimesia algae]|uniref:hypothetical protein n=1 Tax=Gimesia algae TaxID=2527971 RepID=UPI0018D7DFA2|nr:hypothetical protein [Gimesia algae]
MKILFLHGWNSVVGGKKPTLLKEHGHTIINPTLPDDDFEEAVRIAQSEFDQHQPDVIVGFAGSRTTSSSSSQLMSSQNNTKGDLHSAMIQ